MAQRTEKEETEFKIVPEPIPAMVSPVPNSISTSSSSIMQHKSGRSSSPRSSPVVKLNDAVNEKRDLEVKETVLMKREVNRCSGCRRKVGLTGFRCRCGELFCSQHRYSDRHDCSFDYKSAGREAIARENPVVKAAKIVRI